MKILDNAVRIFVGVLFIFSGLVKLNDPMGTEIKMQEYFEVFATDFANFFELFIPLAMPIALFVIILEIVLGVAILLNHDMKWTLGLTAGLIVFFTFLTFYSAYFDKVTDCGCFGDAIPLTPWESFTKDVILVVLIGYMIARFKNFKPLANYQAGYITLAVTTIISMALGFYAIRHLPFIDFRPYAVGDNIPANMIAPETPNFVYTFEKDGEQVESLQYLSAEEGYTYVGHKITNEEMTIPKITDYNIWNEEIGDYTQQSFIGLKLLVIVYESGKADISRMPEIANLVDELGVEVETIALTASAGDDFRDFLATYNLDIPFFYGDATVLKAMVRSSPGIMLLNDGTVLGKWHFNDVPTSTSVKALF
jgi:uncharacterized membrane protein YphA (DoxX/SURF4 family)